MRAIVLATCLVCALAAVDSTAAQGGWSASVSVQPFPPAYPSAWEFDPHIVNLMVTAAPGTDPNYRTAITMIRNGTVAMTGTGLDRSLPQSTLSEMVYTPDLIDWPSTQYGGSVASFIDETERFPEGDYELQVRVQAVSDGHTLAETTAQFTITYPDPPSILFPGCGDEIDSDFPVFQWTPVQAPVQYPVHYVLRISRVNEGQIPETALRSNIPWHQNLDVRSTSYQYPVGEQPLEPGVEYAWRVQVLDEYGYAPATNNGLSETCTFWGPQSLYNEPPLATDALVALIRTDPNNPFAGSSFEGLEDGLFIDVLRRLSQLVSDESVESIALPLPSPVDFETIELPNVEVSIDSLKGVFTIATQIEILGQLVDVAFAGLGITRFPGGGDGVDDTTAVAGSRAGGGSFVFGVRPPEFRFGDLIEPLGGTILDDLELGGNLLAFSSSPFRLEPEALPLMGADLFGSLPIELTPGLNFHHIVEVPGSAARLEKACDLLGITGAEVELAGTVDISLDALRSPTAITESVDLSLSATLTGEDPSWFPEWLDVGSRTVSFEMDSTLRVIATAHLEATLDGEPRSLSAGVDISDLDGSGAVVLRAEMDDTWQSPFGIEWIDLDDAAITLTVAGGDSTDVAITGSFGVGTKTCDARIEIAGTGAGQSASFTGSVDKLSLADALTLGVRAGFAVPDPVPGDELAIEDVTVSVQSSDANTFAVTGTVTVFDAEGDLLVSVTKRSNADPELLIGVRIPELALAELVPPLGGTIVGNLTMPEVAFTIVQEIGAGGATGSGEGDDAGDGIDTENAAGGPGGPVRLRFPAASLSPAALDFYRPVYSGSGVETDGDFAMVLSPGINLGGRLPLEPLGDGLLTALGFSDPSPEVVLEGSLGLEIDILSGDGLASVSSWHLHAELPARDRKNLPDWLEIDPNTQRTLDIGMDPDGVDVAITDVLKAELDGKQRTFVFSRSLATEDSTAALTMRGEMRGGWKQPYGIKWMDLEEVAIELTAGTDGTGALLASKTKLGGKTVDISVRLEGGKKEQTATFTASIDKLSSGEFADLIRQQLGLEGPVFDWSPPKDLLELEDPTITIVVGTETAFSLSALTTLFDQSADLQFFSRKERGQKPQFLLAVRPEEMSLSGLLPELESPVIESIKIPRGALVVSKSERRIDSEDLTDDTRSFYGEIYGTDEFRLDIAPGLNLVAPLPLGDLDESSPLKKALELLFPDTSMDRLVMEGTLPGAILGLGGESGLSGLSLKASFPAIRPKAEWLVETQLALAITGRPSVGFAGLLTVKADEDELTFITEINIAIVPAGVELGLLGALEAEEPWDAPMGVEWLTFNEVRLKTAINPVAVKFGFLARVKIGEKDIEIIAMLPINLYTGVPTGIGLVGASEEGVALSDIADLQYRMAQAAGRSQPMLPIDEIPDMAVRDLDFRFSTLEDPDLDLRLGMTVGGQLWVEMEPDQMENFAGILFDVSLDGILGQAHLGNFALGPMMWQDALLDIALTLPDRHMIIEGGVDLGFGAGQGKLNMAKRKMEFAADVAVLGKFGCALSGEGELALGASNLTVHGALENDFGGMVGREVEAAFQNVGQGGDGEVVAAARAAVQNAERLYAERQAAVAAAREVIAAGRKKIADERDAAKREMDSARRSMKQASSAKDNAHRAWQNTPRVQVAKRNARWRDYLSKQAAYRAARATFRVKQTSYLSKVAAYNALKPIDDYPRVKELLAAANVAKARLEKRRQEVEKLGEDLKAVAAGIGPGSISVKSAEFTTKLARASQGGGVNMQMVVTVKGDDHPVELTWQFGRTRENAAAIVAQLVSRIRKL